MLRRLHPDQPDSFAFTPANQAWAEAQITKYPEGRQASAIIPLLWRAQEQESWLSRPAIEHIADMLGMAYIRALEVATFYFMFQLQPVGSVAHVQICGTTSCMICGAEDLIAVCQDVIADKAHALSADGKFSWEEVECLGACANAPMAQIGKDYYEDLTADKLREILAAMAAGSVPTPGPQNGRYAAEPRSGLSSLTEYDSGRTQYNASVQLASDIGDTIKRIDGTEVPLVAPWGKQSGATGKDAPGGKTDSKADSKSGAAKAPKKVAKKAAKETGTDKPTAKKDAASTAAAKAESATASTATTPTPSKDKPADATGVTKQAAKASSKAKPKPSAAQETQAKPAAKTKKDADPAPTAADGPGRKPEGLAAARAGGADDLKMIKGIGPALEKLCHELGFFHFDQIAAWGGEEIAWVDQNLKGFKGRVSRDTWVAQAKTLAEGGTTEFANRVKKGGVYE